MLAEAEKKGRRARKGGQHQQTFFVSKAPIIEQGEHPSRRFFSLSKSKKTKRLARRSREENVPSLRHAFWRARVLHGGSQGTTGRAFLLEASLCPRLRFFVRERAPESV